MSTSIQKRMRGLHVFSDEDLKKLSNSLTSLESWWSLHSLA